MDNEIFFKNLNFNKTKQILKKSIDKSDNNDLLWILLLMICLSFDTEKKDEILENFYKEYPELKEQIEKI